MPVIAYGAGGVRDSVIEGETGVFCAEQTAASLAAAILGFEDTRFDEHAIRDNARRFAPARFRAEMSDVLHEQRSLMAVRVSEDETRARRAGHRHRRARAAGAAPALARAAGGGAGARSRRRSPTAR